MRWLAWLPVPLQQFINQFVFLAVGKFAFKLSVTWLEIGLILLFSIVVEHALLWIRDRRLTGFSKPAVSTGFNIAFMLGATHFKVYAVAIAAGLAQKHLGKKVFGAHFQNPSNFGIVAALLLFPEYSFVTYVDWGQTLWFAGVIVLLAVLLLQRLQLVYLPVSFLVTYAVLQLLLVSPSPHAVFWSMGSAGFLLFAFFMLTDPKALPATRPFAALHGMTTALSATILPLWLGDKEVNLFLALVLASCLVPLWRKLESRSVSAWRVAAAGAGTCVVLAVALFFSPWNLARNARLALTAATVLRPVAMEPANAPAPITDASRVWADLDGELYETSWPAEGKLVRRPLNSQQESGRGFRDIRRFPAYAAAVTPADLGDETRMYAGVVAGDLNHDGYLDVILHRIREPLRILINDRQGGFLDATAHFFDDPIPESIEHLALADWNGDSWLDLVVAGGKL